MASSSFALPGGGELSYDDHIAASAGPAAAEGPAFVLVPGMGDLRGVYRALVPLLLAGGARRVVACDLRGMGESDPRAFKSFAPLDSGRDVSALVRGLGLRDCVLVGGSMAAASVAWAAAEELPAGRVRGVVMLGPFAWDHAMPFGVPALLSLMLMNCWGAGMWASYYRGLYQDRPPADLATHVARVRANLAAGGRLAVLREQIFSLKLPCSQRLPELAAAGLPLLAMYGTKDPDFSSTAAEVAELKKRVPHAEAVEAVGAGHYPQSEQPELVAKSILDWLARHPPRVGAPPPPSQ